MAEALALVTAMVAAALLTPFWGLVGVAAGIALGGIAGIGGVTLEDRLKYGNWIWEIPRWH